MRKFDMIDELKSWGVNDWHFGKLLIPQLTTQVQLGTYLAGPSAQSSTMIYYTLTFSSPFLFLLCSLLEY